MTDLINWLHQLAKDVFTAIWDLISDAFIALIEMVFNVLGAALSAIPAPSFLTQYSLSTLFGGIDPAILYYASGFRLGECFAVLGLGFAFRMTRKLLTLGQW